MTIELKVIDIYSSLWTDSISTFTTSTFAGSAWLDIIKNGLHCRDFCIAGFEDENIVCVMPAVVINIGFVNILYSSIPFGGIFGSPGHIQSFLNELPYFCRKHHLHKIRIQKDPFDNSYNILNYSKSLSLFPVLSTDYPADFNFTQTLSSSIRANIRRAQKSGVIVKLAENRDDVCSFFDLYLSSMRRNKAVAKYPLQYFLQMYDIMRDKGILRMYIASIKDKAIAGIITVRSNRVSHYLHGGSDAAYSSLRANDLLFFHAITDCIVDDVQFFSFGGTSPHDSELLRFKMKWGSEIRNVYTYDLDVNKLFCNLLKIAESLLKNKYATLLYNKMMNR